ncbi:MAG: hypothetical protein E2O92_10000 [Alphaproteobacteria bacterium]|nr:MAG: hypothetical protein E2O92_10000 [Alphaproteobacteria bacterium]
MQRLKQFSGILVFMTIGLAIYILWGQGLFTHVEDDFGGSCTPIAGAPGSEDLTIDQVRGIVYFSSMDRVKQAQGLAQRGAILALDLNDPDASMIDLTTSLGLGLVPHGISLWKNPLFGPDRLFVINHFGGRHSVEIFEIDADGLTTHSLTHVSTVRGSAMVSPNDLVAVSANQFLVTNDSRWTEGNLALMEKVLRLPVSNVVYYNGVRFSEAIGAIAFANGINISADGQQLYLASMGTGSVLVFDRDITNGGYKSPWTISVPGQPDNIEVMPDGSLLVGLHTKMLSLMTSMLDPEAVIPSRIVRIDLINGDVSNVYDNSGTQIAAASVASIYQEKLIIGAIADPDILICNMP